MNQNTKMLLGALVAAALAIAGFYGLVSPQQATSIQNQANQAFGTGSQQQSGQLGPNVVPQAQPASNPQTSTASPSVPPVR